MYESLKTFAKYSTYFDLKTSGEQFELRNSSFFYIHSIIIRSRFFLYLFSIALMFYWWFCKFSSTSFIRSKSIIWRYIIFSFFLDLKWLWKLTPALTTVVPNAIHTIGPPANVHKPTIPELRPTIPEINLPVLFSAWNFVEFCLNPSKLKVYLL